MYHGHGKQPPFFEGWYYKLVSADETHRIAVIPGVQLGEDGHAFVQVLDGDLFRFATYTGAKIEMLSLADDRADMVISDAKYILEMTAVREHGGLLRGPTQVDMGMRVAETLGAEVQVRLRTVNGREVFSGRGRHGGLEIQGDIERLLAYS
jgi:hypothetical protein